MLILGGAREEYVERSLSCGKKEVTKMFIGGRRDVHKSMQGRYDQRIIFMLEIKEKRHDAFVCTTCQ